MSAISCQHDLYALGLVLIKMILGKLILDMDIFFDDRGRIRKAGIETFVDMIEQKSKPMSQIVTGLLEPDSLQRMTSEKVISLLKDINTGLLELESAPQMPTSWSTKHGLTRGSTVSEIRDPKALKPF